MKGKLIKKYYLLLIFGCCITFCPINHSQIFAQSSLIEVAAEVDKSTITIGDRVKYTLTITRNKNLRIEQPGPGANLGMFEIKEYEIHESVEKDDNIIEKFDYSISVYDTGKFVIPPFPVAFFPSDTSKEFQLITSEPIEIFVESVLAGGDAEIRDIKPPLPVPYNYFRLILIIALIVLLLSSLIFGYIYYQKRKKGEPLFRKEIIRPAHEIAIEELNKLLAGSYLSDKQFKLFFSELSDINRNYVENRFFIKALEETTTELFESIQGMELDENAVDKLREVLDLSDLVKFAKYAPEQKEIDSAIQNTWGFIELTRLEFKPVEVLKEMGEEESSKEVPVKLET
jgi:hypothetical protein